MNSEKPHASSRNYFFGSIIMYPDKAYDVDSFMLQLLWHYWHRYWITLITSTDSYKELQELQKIISNFNLSLLAKLIL